jgi:hypothetical protein
LRRLFVFFTCAALAACLFPSLDTLTGADGGATDANSDQVEPNDANVDAPHDASNDVSNDAIGDAAAEAAPITIVQAAGLSYFGDALAVSVTTASPQTKGNLNVVSLSWQGDGYISLITSVTDGDGNTYTAAVGPTNSNVVGHAIYYAKNILGGAQENKITVTSLLQAGADGGTDDINIAVVEIAGLDPSSPFETKNESSGNSPMATSKSLVTTTARSFLFAGAGLEYGFSWPADGGTSFTPIPLAWGNRDVVGYQVLQTTGTYFATAQLAGNGGNWNMQAAVFK